MLRISPRILSKTKTRIPSPPSPPRSVGCYQPQDGSHPGNAFGQRELPHHSWESVRIHDWSMWGYKSLAPWPKIQSWTFWRDIQAPKLPMGSAEVSVWLQGCSITLSLPHLLHSFFYRSCSWDHSPINFLHPTSPWVCFPEKLTYNSQKLRKIK